MSPASGDGDAAIRVTQGLVQSDEVEAVEGTPTARVDDGMFTVAPPEVAVTAVVTMVAGQCDEIVHVA